MLFFFVTMSNIFKATILILIYKQLSTFYSVSSSYLITKLQNISFGNSSYKVQFYNFPLEPTVTKVNNIIYVDTKIFNLF